MCEVVSPSMYNTGLTETLCVKVVSISMYKSGLTEALCVRL